MSEEWCRQQLMNLQIKDRRLDTLNEIRNRLTKLPADEVASVSSNFLPLSELFDCVEDNQERYFVHCCTVLFRRLQDETTNFSNYFRNEQSSLACDILSLCMSNLDLADTSRNCYYLERSLEHPNDNVKVLGLNEVDRISKQLPNQSFSQNVIIAVVKCLENPQEKVGILAVKILPTILPKFLTDHSVHVNLNRLLTSSDLIRCRVYDVSTAIARESADNLGHVAYVIDRLCTDLDSNDVLLELNILEFLSDLAQTDHGWLYLENKGIFKKITEKMDNLEGNPLKTILFPGYMKFFGNIALKQPAKIIQGFSIFVNSVLDLLLECIVSDTDGNTLPVVFDTLGESKLILKILIRFLRVLRLTEKNIFFSFSPTRIQ